MSAPSALLRGVAIAIATAALVDPSMTMSGASRPRLAVVIAQTSPDAERLRSRLAADFGRSFEILPSITSDTAAAIVIGDQYVDQSAPDELPIATVTVPPSDSDVRIVRVDAPADAPAGTAIHVGVDLDADGASGRTTDLSVRIGGLEVGRASHVWSEAEAVQLKPDATGVTTGVGRGLQAVPNASASWHAGIDVVPVGEPPYAVRVEAVTGDRRAFADAVVEQRREPFKVQIYEPRPSWATTFVRRALESDARFQVAGISFSSRAIASRTRDDVPLGDPRLDAFDVVIVGGLEKLSAADAGSLDRFMRERGGAVVLLPDARPDAAPVSGLLPGDVTERLLEQPAKLTVTSPAAAILASELLVMHRRTPDMTVVASLPAAASLPVIVSVPRGDGRLLMSGAMDAWRFRAADNAAFDRFWRSTVAGLALAAPPPVSVRVDPAVLLAGGRGRLTVRIRAHDAAREAVAVSATLNGDEPIRLTPAAEAGVFHGTVVAGLSPGRLRLAVEVGGSHPQSASRPILVQADARQVTRRPIAPIAMLSSSHRGIDVTADRLADLEPFIRGVASAPAVHVRRRPMRSGWWIVPFAACLSAEWWIRRRRGLR